MNSDDPISKFLNSLGSQSGKKMSMKTLIISLVAIFVLITQFPLGTVGAGERGVLLRFEAVTGKVYDEGLYFRIPFIERVVIMDVQIQKDEVEANGASKDLQSVSSRIALNYHLAHENVARVYQEVRQDYRERIIGPAIQESVKAATAQFTAEELITNRAEVRDKMQEILTEKLTNRGILIDSFNIVHFDFSDSFNSAIEAKVTAEQEALAAKNKLEQVKFEAQQKIEEARGKAEAISIEAQALRSNPAVLELRALEKWDGVLPKVTGESVPFISID